MSLYRTVLSCLLIATTVAPPLAAVDFVRGDANSDGVVSPADAYFLSRWLLRSGPAPECVNATDLQDRGAIGEGYALVGALDVLFNFIHGSDAVDVPAPFPEPGPDPTPNTDPQLDCANYGSGQPIEDPTARLSILDAVATGGSEQLVTVTLALSNSRPLAGFSGELEVADSVLAASPRIKGVWADSAQLIDLTGTMVQPFGFPLVRVTDSRLRFAFLNSFGEEEASPIPPGENVPVAEVILCLSRGTVAGAYGMTLVQGELIDADSGQTTSPTLQHATLTVQSDLDEDVGCFHESPQFCALPPDQLEARFSLADVSVQRGETFSMPLTMRSNIGFTGFSAAIRYDPEVLEGMSIDPISARPDGKDYSFEMYDINEGWIVAAAVLAFNEPEQIAPPHTDVEVGRLHMRVHFDAPLGATPLEFLDGAPSPFGGREVGNALTVCDTGIAPEAATSFTFVDAVVGVVDEVTVFRRGDSDGDGDVTLTDCVVSLDYLFLGGVQPSCFDAADANDDGEVSLSDPVRTLNRLFLGGPALPPPFPEPGVDPTEDRMTCRSNPTSS